MKHLAILLGIFTVCSQPKAVESPDQTESFQPYILVLGTAQDAGYPHIACTRACCKGIVKAEPVSCLALIDPGTKSYWILDATPDMPDQLRFVESRGYDPLPNGVFLTHAHIGHYTGLMYFGHEAAGSKSVPVYAMPRMLEYLRSNGPWSQLVEFKNIELRPQQAGRTINLNEAISIEPFLVPHRDELSETVGYKISGPDRTVLFIPDIDKWEKWGRNIIKEITKVDLAFVDGSFFADGELPNRDMSKILHPFVSESMELLKEMSEDEKSKVHFIHFNHTNPLLNPNSAATKEVLRAGFKLARTGQTILL